MMILRKRILYRGSFLAVCAAGFAFIASSRAVATCVGVLKISGIGTEIRAVREELRGLGENMIRKSEKFASKYSRNAVFLPGTSVSTARRGSVQTQTRNILLISTEGTDDATLRTLREDYAENFSHQTVSPLFSEHFFHLRVRVGNQSLDVDPDLLDKIHLDIEPYALASRRRLEPLIVLTQTEWKNFDTYVRSIQENPLRTIGEGREDVTVASEETFGSLWNNRFIDAGDRHNCTTWFMMAPIGEHGEMLYRLIGAQGNLPSDYRVHSSIKRTAHFFAFGAANERVPIIAVWTKEKLGNAAAEILHHPETLDSYVLPW